jgi:hypothetical protein
VRPAREVALAIGTLALTSSASRALASSDPPVPLR